MGEETEQDKETQVFLEDDGIYEDVDTTNWKLLGVIQEESDSDYYRSVDYCNAYSKNSKRSNDSIYENVTNFQGRLGDTVPVLHPKTVSDKIFNFKKDFSNHNYVNIDYEPNTVLDRRTKNEMLRQQFFSNYNNVNKYPDKNVFNDKFNRLQDKKIECHTIRNDVTKTGSDVKVAGALNMKLLNLDRYNRVLTTTETFMETTEASFTKNELNIKKNNIDSYIKRTEKYNTTEHRERETKVALNNSSPTPKGQTEIRIKYNPTFLATQNIKGFCEFCKKSCPRTESKCCSRCVCVEPELRDIWREDWLNILLILALIIVLLAILIQWLLKKICKEEEQGCYETLF